MGEQYLEVQLTDLELVGGKNASLGEMIHDLLSRFIKNNWIAKIESFFNRGL